MSNKLSCAITLFLMILTLYTIIPYNAYAAIPSAGDITAIRTLMKNEGYNYPDSDIASEATKLLNDGVRLYTRVLVNGAYQHFNIAVYKNYDIIVYGKRHNHPGERCDAYGEYRFLGYDEYGGEVYNDRFDNDADSNTDLTKKNWQIVDLAKKTWEDYARHEEQRTQILTAKPIENDGASCSYSISEILKNTSGTEAKKQKVQVMTAPRMLSKGTVRLQHKTSSGKPWYDSFTIPKLDYSFNPSCTVAPQPGTYIIKETETEITIPIDVTANLSMSAPLGKTPAQIIGKSYAQPGMVPLSYKGSTQDAAIAGNTAKATFHATFKRTDLKVGTNAVPLTGQIDYLKSIYTDDWPSIPGTGSVIIEVKASGEPYVDITAIPNPDSCKFNNADIPVRVNVSTALQNYTNLSNISNIVIYAKFDDDPANVYQTKTLAAALTAATSFDFTIPRSKVTGDTLNQKFKITAVFHYRTPVNSQTNTSGTTYCTTYIYKEYPPEYDDDPDPTNKPPIAVIDAPNEVKAGDDVVMSGARSSDEDGSIVEYQWDNSGATSNIYGASGSVWFPNEGTYTQDLIVKDNGGAYGYDAKSITVLPPTPEAKIKVTGTLKENRRFTIDATDSYSPVHYPIVWASTLWSLSPLSGHNAADIKYSGTLNGSSTKDILIKKAGTDRLDLTVQNTKGLSGAEQLNITIAPDLSPIANFNTVTTILRDPTDANYSKLTINDTSYSPDNDYIQNILVYLSYNNDNTEGTYDGAMTIDASTFLNGETKTITTPWAFDVLVTVNKPEGKPMSVDIRTKHIGKYYVDLRAIEGFGQETIPAYITAADYRWDDTADKPNIEKTIEVINLAPVAGFSLTNKRKVDIHINLGDTLHGSISTVQSKLNSILAPALAAANIDYSIVVTKYNAAPPYNESVFKGKYYYAGKPWGINQDYHYSYDHLTDIHTQLSFPGYINSDHAIDTNGYRYYFDTTTSGMPLYGKNGRFDTNLSYARELRPNNTDKIYFTNGSNTVFYEYNSTTNTMKTIASFSDFTRYNVGPSGKVYFSGSNGKVYNPTTGTLSNLPKMASMWELIMSPDEKIYGWFPSPISAFCEYDPATDIITTLSTNTSLRYGRFGADGYLYYIGSEMYMYKMDVKTRESTYLLTLPYTSKISAIYPDNKIYFTYGESGEYKDLGIYAIDTNTYKSSANRILEGFGKTSLTLPPLLPKVDYLGKAIDAVTWRDLSERYYIQIDDKEIRELKNNSQTSKLLSSVLSKQLAFVALGTDTNKAQLESLIAKNEYNGTYINNTNLDTAITKLTDYIQNKKTLDLVLNVGDSPYDLAATQSKVNAIIKPVLAAYNISTNISYVQGLSYNYGKLYAKGDNVFALTPDGSLYACGKNTANELGDGTNTNRTTPVKINISNVKDVYPGLNHTIIVKNDGTVWGIGQGNYGVFGYQSGAQPFQLTDEWSVKMAGQGNGFQAVLRTDGTVWTRGWNAYQQLGNGDTSNSQTWYYSAPILSNIKSIAVGDLHTLAVTNAGTIKSWGSNYGWCALGTGDNSIAYSPVDVPGLTNIKEVYAGASLSAALTNDGKLYVWGWGTDYYIPTLYTGGGTNVRDIVDVKVSGYDVIFLRSDGTVWHFNGQGTRSLVQVPNLSNIVSIASGYNTGYAMKKDGSVYSWNYDYYNMNTNGALGNGTTYDNKTPAPVSGGAAGTTYLNLASKSNAELNTILANVSLRPTADHMFIDVNHAIRPELYDPSKRAGVLDNLKANEMDYIGFVSPVNAAQAWDIVVSNDYEGASIDSTNLDDAMNVAGWYIATYIKKKTPNLYKYVLMGEEVVYNTTYEDIESDPIYSERWKFTHNDGYFDSSLGVITDSGAYRSAPYTTFNKTGMYEITYGARDNPKSDDRFDNYRLWSNEGLSKATIYVHRKPIASYLWTVLYNSGKFTLSTTDTSEDKDHISRADKGITKKVWKWKQSTDEQWQMGTPNELTKGNAYLVQLQVQDLEGAWSDPYVQSVEVPDLIIDVTPPFRDWANTDVNVTVTTTRTGIPTLSDLKYTWTDSTSKPAIDGTWTTNMNMSFNTGATQEGEWYIHISATDSNGLTYYKCFGPYRIDKTPPTSMHFSEALPPTNKNTFTFYLSKVRDALSGVDYVLLPTWNTTNGQDDIIYYNAAFNPALDRWEHEIDVANHGNLDGEYVLNAYAWDKATNYAYLGWLYIIVDRQPPTISADPSTAVSSNPIPVNVNVADVGLSGIKRVRYQWTDTTFKPGDTDPFWNTASGSFSTTQSAPGANWSLHVEAFDNAGNSTYKCFGPYKIESLKLQNFRVTMVRDLQLASYYYNSVTGKYDPKPMYVNSMALDGSSFGGTVTGLTKGYLFEFELDSSNFNESLDAIEIEPHFYTGDLFTRDTAERDVYWEDSKHQTWKAGQGGHSAWAEITLTAADRIITGSNTATWKGEYLIPGTSWAVPKGTSAANAKSSDLKRDIIVHFQIKGYKAGVLKFDYNTSQWPLERTIVKAPYEIGDVIRYSYQKSNLDDIKSKDNR